VRIAIFAEVDANFVEGPAIWLVNLAKGLASQPGTDVTILLRTRLTSTEVMEPLRNLDNVTLVDPYARGWADEAIRPQLSVERAVALLEQLDGEKRFDVVVLRGVPVSCVAAGRAILRDRLACYLTDFPQPPAAFGFWARRRLRRALRHVPLLLCQTVELRDYLVAALSIGARPQTSLLPPMVDESAFGDGPDAPTKGRPLRLAYIGKFAPAWNTLEMCALPEALAAHGIDCTLEIAGDKFLGQPDATFPERMRKALQTSRGVVWHGGLPQSQAQRLAAGCHIGLSWRSAALDGSLELSTKLLEYSALGLPVLCNPTPMHRRLLGDDYPLFVTQMRDFPAAIARALQPQSWRAAAQAARALAEAHRASRISADIGRTLQEVFR
jgi:hypothetical protein